MVAASEEAAKAVKARLRRGGEDWIRQLRRMCAGFSRRNGGRLRRGGEERVVQVPDSRFHAAMEAASEEAAKELGNEHPPTRQLPQWRPPPKRRRSRCWACDTTQLVIGRNGGRLRRGGEGGSRNHRRCKSQAAMEAASEEAAKPPTRHPGSHPRAAAMEAASEEAAKPHQ